MEDEGQLSYRSVMELFRRHLAALAFVCAWLFASQAIVLDLAQARPASFQDVDGTVLCTASTSLSVPEDGSGSAGYPDHHQHCLLNGPCGSAVLLAPTERAGAIAVTPAVTFAQALPGGDTEPNGGAREWHGSGPRGPPLAA